MGRMAHLIGMRRRMEDVDFQLLQAHNRLIEEEFDDDRRVALAGELDAIQRRRDLLRAKLAALEDVPDLTWDPALGEWEQEYDDLVHDLDQRIAPLT